MASDEIVWDIINNQFCSFKIKTTNKQQAFCRNEFNVSGYCSKQNCPLANSRYATVRSDPSTGRIYLYTKTIERAHLPSKWWERIRLPGNYDKALAMLDERLEYWPKFLVHKCKQRLTRLTQVAIRTRRIQKEEERLGERLVPKLAPKVRGREATRERKAEAAARIERAIERELVERLRSGAYGDRPLNVEEGVWKRVLCGLERSGEGVQDEDLDVEEEEEGEDGEKEYEYENEGGEVEYVSGDDDDLESNSELEDLEDWLGGESQDESESASGSDSDADSEEEEGEEDAKLKAKLDSLKRKRKGPEPKKPAKKSAKGPKRMIEYEHEPAEMNLPQLLTA